MYETVSTALGLQMTPRAASVWFGLALGIAFGALALLTRFCLRRALVGPQHERAAAGGVWALALGTAVLGTQAAVAAGLVGFDAHRFHAAGMPVLAIVTGGLLFGVGTVLARGCITRLTVLTGGGNLRALTGILVFALAAHATMQGVLAPVRSTLGQVTVSPGVISLGDLPGGPWLWTLALVAAVLLIAVRSGAGRAALLGAAALGALVPLGWVGTGFLLYDEFDPIALEGLSSTGPWAEALFWSLAASLTEPGFGTGLTGGILAGATLAAILSGRFAWEGFETPAQMGRTISGAALMGVGGVLAGGCTVGAGLSGVATLSLAALLALGSIVAGILLAATFETRTRRAPGLVAAE